MSWEFIVLSELAGFGLFGYSFKIWSKKRLVENTPTSKVRSIAMGPVELKGKVSAEKTLTSPFSNQSCVYYKFVLKEYRKQGKHSSWVTIRSGDDSYPFYLKDDTASVLVNPRGAELDVPMSYNITTRRDPPANIMNFFQKEGIRHEGFFGINKQLKYQEWILKPNDEVYVFGTAGDNPNVEEATAKNSVDDIMISKGKTMFFISNKDEKGVIARFRNRILLGFIAGPALIILGLIIMFINLSLL